jgi:YVTN family beta-propeller protein
MGKRSRITGAKPTHRRHSELYAWLGAGALSVGVGVAATAGTGVAHADSPVGRSTAAVNSAAGAKVGEAISAGPSRTRTNSVANRAAVAAAHPHAPTGAQLGPAEMTATKSVVAKALSPTGFARLAPLLPAATDLRVIPSASVSVSPTNGLLGAVTNALLTLGGLNTTTPTPARGNLWQMAFYSVARWLQDTVNPAGIPRAGTPTISAPDETTGAVTFRPSFTDAAGAPLTYVVSADPAIGKVSANADGAYIFTPTQASQLQASAGGLTAHVSVTAFNGVQNTTQTVALPISPVTPQLLASLPIYGAALAVDPTGTQLVVLPHVGANSDGLVKVVNSSSDTVTATVTVGPTFPVGVAMTSDGLGVYITNPGAGSCPTCGGTGTASEMALINDSVIATIPVGYNPQGVAVGPANTPAAGKVYVANACDGGQSACQSGLGTVSVIDSATNKVTATITVGPNGYDLAVGPDGKFVYVQNADGSVSVIDTAKNRVAATIQTSAGGLSYSGSPSLAVSPDGGRLYVLGFKGSFNTVLDVVNTSTDLVTNEIPLSGSASVLAISPDGSVVYVANTGTSQQPGTTVSVISTATHKIINTIAVGRGPGGMVVSPDGSRLYVSTGDGLWVVGV